MDHQTVLIVPATVPDAQVTRVARPEPEAATVQAAEPAPVPTAEVVPVIPEQLTPEQVAQLREENDALREELERVRSS